MVTGPPEESAAGTFQETALTCQHQVQFDSNRWPTNGNLGKRQSEAIDVARLHPSMGWIHMSAETKVCTCQICKPDGNIARHAMKALHVPAGVVLPNVPF